MSLGYNAQQEGRYGEAVQYFRNALYINPDDRYMRLGYDATQRNEYRTALDFFEQGLALRPNDDYASEAIENVSTYLAN